MRGAAMKKRAKPEISLRGKGRALFAGLTEWAEPPEAPAPDPGPLEAAALPPAPEGGPPGEPPPTPEAASASEPTGAPGEAPAAAASEDGDGFRFLAMEAAYVTPTPSGIPDWAPPPAWRWEPTAAPAEAVQVDPSAPMRALRIPGLLTSEAPAPTAPAPEAAAETHPGGEPPMDRPSIPSVERPPAARSRSADEAHIRQLNARIDELYRRIAAGAIPDPGTAEQALAWLKQAREALTAPDGYDEAEYYYSLAQTRYAIARRLWRWSYTYGLFVFLWGLAWLGFYLWSLTMGRGYSARVVPPGYEGIWEPIMWGGLGGVCGIFYSLYWHVAIKRDFDRQYVMWYLVQPILGSMIGMIIYMIVTVGFLTIQGTPTPANPLFMYLLAFIAGFRQRFFLELIDRIVQTFTPNPRSNP